MSAALRSLRAQPFHLLLELDRRLRAARSDSADGSADVWQGLAFRLGERWLVAPKDDVREVIPPPRLTRVPNARPWLAGVANVRGSLLTVVDSGRLLGDEASGDKRTARVLVLNSERLPAGFLVDEVAGYRQFTVREQADLERSEQDPSAPYLLGGFQREGRVWPVLSLHRLAQSDALRRAGW
ncbi:chemotaxis protein CheW [Panacagrimonas sp.]|uniref:chemotaxis protein CheW n=1 Tax=Panacagrimonas sp. TaxID=2480088 RepID=UPI003B51712B